MSLEASKGKCILNNVFITCMTLDKSKTGCIYCNHYNTENFEKFQARETPERGNIRHM
jgi:hypothetical protein